jgi:hypothetical protein
MDHGQELTRTRAIDAAGRQSRAARRVASAAANFTVPIGALFRCGRAVGPPVRFGNLIL